MAIHTAAQRRAETTWEGNLTQGKGTVSAATSGAFTDLPVTWASRIENSDGRTSPEELIAAAHATCYAMSLASDLFKAGTPPERLHASAVCTLDLVDGKRRITTVELEVTGKVEGIDAATFEAAAEAARVGCPVSNALKNNVKITVKATLES